MNVEKHKIYTIKLNLLNCNMHSVVEIGSGVPAFLGKLWKLVNDSETNHLITWSPGGKTFVIKNQAEFARELLPLYYKHNNMASFIRQLNMYGFHKITSVENGGLRYDKDEIEFSHSCFMRGHAYLLEHIKRKIANPKAIVASSENGEKILLKPEMMNKVLSDVKQMKGKQESLDAKFSAMKQENEALWREVAILRQKHIKQQQIVNNLIQFLMSLVQPTRASSNNANGVGVKRPYQLMINSAAHNASPDGARSNKSMKLETALLEELIEDNQEDGPTIHELVHDDALLSEASQDATQVPRYVTVEVQGNASSPASATSHSENPTPDQYHVTMEDDLENDAEVDYSIGNALLSTPPAEVPTTPSPITLTIPIEQLVDPATLLSPSTSKSRSRDQVKKAPTSGKKILSPSSFRIIQPSADLKLPAEIFASDDSVGDSCNATNEEVAIQDALQNHILNANNTKDKMFGGINIKIEKPEPVKTTEKKSKKLSKDNITDMKLQNIKTELQDDLDWNDMNMSLATVNNNTDINKYHPTNRRDYFTKNLEELSNLYGTNAKQSDIDDHLDTMQTDLESLRELLRSDSYALDTNTLMGLFGSDDPFYGLSFNPVDERSKSANNAKKQKAELSNLSRENNRVQGLYTEDDAEGTNQLMSYTGNIPDFEDIEIPDLEDESGTSCVSPALVESGSVLNTPQVTLRSPSYPPTPAPTPNTETQPVNPRPY